MKEVNKTQPIYHNCEWHLKCKALFVLSLFLLNQLKSNLDFFKDKFFWGDLFFYLNSNLSKTALTCNETKNLTNPYKVSLNTILMLLQIRSFHLNNDNTKRKEEFNVHLSLGLRNFKEIVFNFFCFLVTVIVNYTWYLWN